MEFEALPCPEPLHNCTILSAPAFWILQNHYSLHVKNRQSSHSHIEGHLDWNGI